MYRRRRPKNVYSTEAACWVAFLEMRLGSTYPSAVEITCRLQTCSGRVLAYTYTFSALNMCTGHMLAPRQCASLRLTRVIESMLCFTVAFNMTAQHELVRSRTASVMLETAHVPSPACNMLPGKQRPALCDDEVLPRGLLS